MSVVSVTAWRRLLERGFEPTTLRLFVGVVADIEIGDFLRKMAPQAGFEPATLRLTG